jgi:hypothetical protein
MIFYNTKTAKNIEINFHSFDLKDTKQYIGCISDFYGDGYPYKRFLDGEYLDKLCKQGKMLVICGETSDGEIVSTSGINLDNDFKKSGLLMLRVVKKNFQNMGIGNKQQDFLFEQMDKLSELCSVYADVMTHNTTSQNSLVRESFVYTGIRFMLYHNKIMIPHYPFAHEYKLSQVIMCKSVSCNSVGEIYCPTKHSLFVEDIYKKLGVTCTIKTALLVTTVKRSNILLHADDIHNHLQFIVFDVGKDFEQIVKEQLLQFNPIKGQTYICYLNMKAQGSIHAYDILSRYGFFFSGIKPLNANGEFMMLSKVTGEILNTDDIKLHKNGRYMMEYIREHRKTGDAI